MRVVLFQPRSRPNARISLSDVQRVEPLGLEMVAAAVPKSHDVGIYDLLEENWLLRGLESMRPRVCGITCQFTCDLPAVTRIASTIKSFDQEIFVVVGGHAASLQPYDLWCADIDAIVVGEGEVTFPELLDCLEQGGDVTNVAGLVINTAEEQVTTEDRPLIKDIDSLPLPARHLLRTPRDAYSMPLSSLPPALILPTRGCTHRCKFCTVWRLNRGTYRSRSAQSTFDEIRRLSARDIVFADDNFFGDTDMATELAHLVKESGIKKRFLCPARSDTICRHPELIELWAEIGLTAVLVGFEYLDDDALSSVGKKVSARENDEALRIASRNKVFTHAGFIVDPDWSHAEFERLHQYLEGKPRLLCQFSVATPLPGTEFYDEVEHQLTDRTPALYDCLHAVLPTKLTLEEFYGELARLYRANMNRMKESWPFRWMVLRGLLGREFSLGRLRRTARVYEEFTKAENYLAGHTNADG